MAFCIIFSRRSEGGIAPVSGTGDRGFESHRFDQKRESHPCGDSLFFGQSRCPTRTRLRSNAGSHTLLGDRGACSPGGEQRYIRLGENPTTVTLAVTLSFFDQSRCPTRTRLRSNGGSHTLLGDRGACSPDGEQRYIRLGENPTADHHTAVTPVVTLSFFD